MSAYTPEQDELLTVIETAHRESWDDATEYSDAPHIIRAAVVRWLAEHDRALSEQRWEEGNQHGSGCLNADYGCNPYVEVSK